MDEVIPKCQRFAHFTSAHVGIRSFLTLTFEDKSDVDMLKY